MKTKAAYLREQNAPLEIGELAVPEPGTGQVLVRIYASTVCGSQLGEIEGVKGPDKFLPHCLGHEGGGVVVAVGEGVKRVKKEDAVVLHWRKADGLQGQPAVYDAGGFKVNAGYVTTFQEYAIVSENRLTVVDPGLPHHYAALYGCCLTTGFGVVRRDAAVKEGQTVTILGCGGVGLAQIAAAKIAGAKKIIAIDIHQNKLEQAALLGADETMFFEGDETLESVLDLTAGGSDYVFENTGIKMVIEDGYEMCGAAGLMVLVGVPRHDKRAQLNTLPLHFGRRITGSHGGATKPDTDIPMIRKEIESAGINLDLFLDRSFKLEEINSAINLMRSGEVIRPWIDLKHE